jgi:Uma2 family endonuclease
MAEGKNFELFDGTPLLMSNPSETHEQIASNIGANLKLAMDKRGCRTYQGRWRKSGRGIGTFSP